LLLGYGVRKLWREQTSALDSASKSSFSAKCDSALEFGAGIKRSALKPKIPCRFQPQSRFGAGFGNRRWNRRWNSNLALKSALEFKIGAEIGAEKMVWRWSRNSPAKIWR